jgi:maleylacetate reductase
MVPRSFTFPGLVSRVVFGTGSIGQVGEELDRIGVRRAIVLATPQQVDLAQAVADSIGSRAVGVFGGAAMHVPIAVVQESREQAQRLGADCAVAIGGGSTIGLGKAIALESGLPILAVPTTYAGSEMTPIYGITAGKVKRTGKDARVLPRTVIYDPKLTVSMPAGLTVTSAINAMAHAAEGLYAQDGNPVMDLFAQEGIRALARAVPVLREHPADIAARTEAAYGAWLCGSVLGNVGMALHHKLCHTLGGSFNLPHAEVHTVVLPHAMAFNAAAAPEAMRRIATALQADSAALALHAFALDNGAPVALRDLGMREEDLDRAAELAVSNPYWNPRPVGAPQQAEIRELLQRAFEGTRPVSGPHEQAG